MSKSTVQNRESRLKGLAVALSGANEAVTLDAVFDKVTHDDENKGLVKLDTILAQDENAESLAGILASSVAMAKENGVLVTADAIDLSIHTVEALADQLVTMDGINTVDGSAVVATATAFNQYVILNSNIAGLDGNIADMEALRGGDKNNTKFKIYSVNPEVTDGMGDIEDKTILTPKNISKAMALASRDMVQEVESDVTEYVFTATEKTSSSSYAIGRGVTELILGDTGIVLNDYEVSAQETNPIRTVTLDGGQVTMKLTYDDGKIEVTVDDGALPVGTKLYVSTSLSPEKIGKIRGFVGSNIQDFTYIAHPVTIGTKANMLDIRQVQQQVGHSLLPTGLQVAGQKIASEILGKKIDLASRFATHSGTPIDLTVNRGLATTNEAYKLLTVAIDSASVEILEESMLTDNVIVIGGKGLIDAFGMMSKNTDGLTIRDTNTANTFKFLGYLDGKYPAYYDPRHDDKYPRVDEEGVVNSDATKNVYNTLLTIGTPADPAKRAVIYGVGLPIVPVDLKINDNSEQKIALEGKIVLDSNKDPHARKLAKKILFKTH